MEFFLEKFKLLTPLSVSEHVETFLAVSDNKLIVLKRPRTGLGETYILREVVALRHVEKLPNCPRIIEVITEPVVVLVLEYIEGLVLENFHRLNSLALKHKLKIALKVAKIVDALHRINLIHNDIKPSNLLINPLSFDLTLVDFAHADLLDTRETVFKDFFVGTPVFLAPEAFLGYYSKKSDIYSLTATMYFIFENRMPFQSEKLEQLYNEKKTVKLIFHELDDNEVKFFVSQGLSPKPNARPSAQTLVDFLEKKLSALKIAA
ncbi:MAG: protein kinase [Deltaproteobacteria bacterium]|nr:protein kinase [Deltaproteobacteria bacterium]